MTDLKREYTIPLRRKTKLAPNWRRSKKAMSVLIEFVKKHMKTDEVVICNELNEKIWENGIKNPPGKVSVVALKTNINGVEKTLVNLIEAGVESQLATYNKVTPKAVAPETKADIKEAEVKEVVEKKAEKVVEEKVEEKSKTKSEKATAKKKVEEKKDE